MWYVRTAQKLLRFINMNFYRILVCLCVVITMVVSIMILKTLNLFQNKVLLKIWRPPVSQNHSLKETTRKIQVQSFNLRKNTGLGKDFDVYMHFMPNASLEYLCNGAIVMHKNEKSLFMEHICERGMGNGTGADAPPIIFIPNQELLNKEDERILITNPQIETILCKSEYAGEIFRVIAAKYGCKWKVRVFTFPPLCKTMYYNFPKDRQLFFHPAGKSWMKNTTAVIEAWKLHPEWPMLVVTCSDQCKLIHRLTWTVNQANIAVYNFLESHEMMLLQKHAGNVILPSACEGFGHSIYEACANGNLLITSNIPPMNEFLNKKHVVFVEPMTKHPIGDSNGFEWTKALSKTIGDAGSACFEVSVENIERAVNRTLRLSDEEYDIMRTGALRDWDSMVQKGMISTHNALVQCGLSDVSFNYNFGFA